VQSSGNCFLGERFWTQGRVRTKTVKKASRVIIEKYYGRLTLDFAINQRVCEEVAIIQSKRLRNKIAGFTTVSISISHRPLLTSDCASGFF
jgi:ribosomal protein S17E